MSQNKTGCQRGGIGRRKGPGVPPDPAPRLYEWRGIWGLLRKNYGKYCAGMFQLKAPLIVWLIPAPNIARK